jgi:choline dehydrogenase-like flavoprotein
MIYQSISSISDSSNIFFDVCIIGAGPAGITVARELAGKGLQVLLLEAGGFTHPPATRDHPYRGANIGRPYDPVLTRLRFFGGTSNHWGGWCRPLDAIDFMERDYVPLSGWPIERNDLLPFYEKALDICEVDIGGQGLSVFDEQYSAEPFLHNVFPDYVNKSFYLSPPTRFGLRYRKEIRFARNIHCVLNSTVTELLQTEDRVTRARVKAFNKDYYVSAKCYVIATGAIEAPRLLLNSDQHHVSGLGNAGGYVGRCFSDHLGVVSANVILSANTAYKMRKSPLYGAREIPHLSFSTETLLNNKLINFGILFHNPSIDEGNALEAKTLSNFLSPQEDQKKAYSMLVRFETTPNFKSRVFLDSEIDDNGMRRIILDWQPNDLEFDHLHKITWMINKRLGSSHIGRMKTELDPIIRQKFDASYQAHHLGTTRMANDYQHGVVDSQCRVFGSDNLYIAGSSVFPSFGFANPTLTIVALASRLAHHLSVSTHF